MRFPLTLTLLVWAVWTTGCSSDGYRPGSKVTGKVTQGGTPVAGARVVFTDGNASGAAANGPTAVTDESGQYAIVGVNPGAYKVVVYKFVPKKGAMLPADGEGMDLEQIEASGQGAHALPRKYSTPTTTTLTASVGSGSNEVNLQLDSR